MTTMDTSSSAALTEEQLKAELEGGRDLVRNGKYAEAADKLSNVLQKYVEKYGDLAVECADAYLRYGISLYREHEYNEEQNGGMDVLGAAMPQEVPTGAAPVEEKKEGQEDGAAPAEPEMMEEGEGQESGDGGEESEEGEEGEEGEQEEGEEGEEEGNEGEEEENKEEDGQEQQEKATDDKGKGAAKPKAEDEDPLELAWDCIDLARKIFEDKEKVMECNDRERQLKLSEAYSYLGDINCKNERFEEASSDYTNCLKIREQICCKDDRLLLEVYHSLATSLSLQDKPDRNGSIQAIKNAVGVCETRIKYLKALIAMGDEITDMPESSVKPQPIGDSEKEINDLEEVVVDLLERIEVEEFQLPEEEAAGSSSGAGASSSSAASASAFGGDTIAAMAAAAGFGPSAIPTTEPVKTLGVFGKSKSKAAKEAASSAPQAAESTPSPGCKRPADYEPASAEQEESKKVRLAPVATDGDASAAPTPLDKQKIVKIDNERQAVEAA